MYILIIARGYPTKKHPLYGIFEYDQAKALAELGHKIVFASIDTWSIRRIRKWGFKSIKRDNIHIESLAIPCGRIPKNILNKVRIFILKTLYRRILKKYGKPDIIHSHFIEFGYISTRTFEDSGIPLVITEHSSAMNKDKIDDYYSTLGQYAYPRADRVITVSDELSKKLKANFKIETVTIPNIIDISNFKYMKSDKKSEYFDFISIGRLTEEKGMLNLVESFVSAFKADERTRLFIFGEGILRRKLENIIRENKLEKQIFLKGIRKRFEIAEKMKTSKVFVLASRSETFGVSFIEAMASGLPVISTRSGGPESLVNEENGILIEVDDKKELERALIHMYDNIGDFDKQKISYKISKSYSSKKIAEEITRVYKSLLEESYGS